jgi:hypothetical protein
MVAALALKKLWGYWRELIWTFVAIIAAAFGGFYLVVAATFKVSGWVVPRFATLATPSAS